MRRVMSKADSRFGFDGFCPARPGGEPKALLQPAIVTDRTDPNWSTSMALNLSRAWCMRSIASALPAKTDRARRVLTRSALAHAKVHAAACGGGIIRRALAGSSFAVYLLTTPDALVRRLFRSRGMILKI